MLQLESHDHGQLQIANCAKNQLSNVLHRMSSHDIFFCCSPPEKPAGDIVVDPAERDKLGGLPAGLGVVCWRHGFQLVLEERARVGCMKPSQVLEAQELATQKSLTS